MKKILFVLTLLLSILMLASCGETETKSGDESQSGTEEASTENQTGLLGFCVGYAKTDITPKYSVPLHGFGLCSERMSDGYLDEIYTTAIAITDPEGETIVLMTTDNCNSKITITTAVREAITAQTGIPGDHILMQATHTHSGPDIISSDTMEESIQYQKDLQEAQIKTILEALANREPAKMYYDAVDLSGYNFERQYFTASGVDISDNHNSATQADPVVRHAHETWNTMMYIVKFTRENDKDIIMTNWRAHPTRTGSSTKYDISADYIAPIRDTIEAETGCYYAFMQGEGGNQNATSRIESEKPNADYYAYGQEIAALIIAQLNKNEMVELNTDKVVTVQESYTVQANHTTDGKALEAKAISTYVNSTGDRSGAATMCANAGIHSIYEAAAIVTRSTMSKEFQIEIHATIIGDLCIVHAPLENFDSLGTIIRENAPTKYFFYCGYANEYNFYMPDQEAFQYSCYESDCTKAAPGEGEKLAYRQAELLKELWTKLGH